MKLSAHTKHLGVTRQTEQFIKELTDEVSRKASDTEES